MNRSRFRSLSFSVALVLAAVGCKGDSKKSPGAALSGIEFMHQDVGVVISFDLVAGSKSKVLAPYRKQLFERGPEEFEELRSVCGFELGKDVKSVVFGVTRERAAVVVVNGPLDQKRIEDCLGKAKLSGGKSVEISTDGRLQVYTAQGAERVFYAFYPRAGTVVMSSNEVDGKATLDAVLDGKTLSGGKIKELASQADSGSMFWLAAIAGVDERFAQTGVEAVSLSMRNGDGVTAQGKLLVESEKRAKEYAAQASGFIAMAKAAPQAKDFKDAIDSIKVEADGKSVKARFKLTAAEVDKLMQMSDKLPAELP